jgi:hypothetical protein
MRLTRSIGSRGARVDERTGVDVLRRCFEAAGFRIALGYALDEDGVRAELDGYDVAQRVGFEYATDEAGDGWDIDDAVIAELAERHRRGSMHVLVVDQHHAPDVSSIERAATAFLGELRELGLPAKKTATKKPAAKKPAAKKPAAKKPAAKKRAK